MPPLQNGDRVTLVQNSRPRIIFQKIASLRDETLSPGTPQDITGFSIQIMVKRLRTDADAAALFSAAYNAPTAAGFRLDGTAIDPTLGHFGWDFDARHTMFPPGIYEGEINMWSSAASLAAGDPPYERYAIEWEILQRTDL